ncbi:hypothetical protein EV424DRAFT_1534087 [Suillus variegatus]|nr:hypothetical protein EV424DRAFT_1534087 [Suillus variegatus]
MEEGMIPVINGIEEPVKSQMLNAGSPIAVIGEDVEVPIANQNVQTKVELNESIAHGQRFRRNGVWGNGVSGCSRTALWTETATPMPQPPACEFLNHGALDTIQCHPSLFKVSTPIKVDVFEALLADHPNQPFVRSVCIGLREGFWSFADTHSDE